MASLSDDSRLTSLQVRSSSVSLTHGFNHYYMKSFHSCVYLKDFAISWNTLLLNIEYMLHL